MTKLTYQRGYDLTDGPVQANAEGITSAVACYGDFDRWDEETNSDTLAAYGRRESSFVARGVAHPGTLRKLAHQVLTLGDSPRRNRTYGVKLGNGRDPGDACDLGDKFFIRDGGVTTKVKTERLHGIAEETDSNGNVSQAVIDVSDREHEHDILILDRQNQIMAATDGLEGGARPNPDTMPPRAPIWAVSAAVVAELYDPPNDEGDPGDPLNGGGPRARVTLNFRQVTKDADLEDCFDLKGYRAYYRYPSQSWQSIEVKVSELADPTDPQIVIDDLAPGRRIYVYLEAFDNKNNPSPLDPADVKTQLLPGDGGTFRTYDASGATIMDTAEGKVRVYKDFEMQTAEGGGIGISMDPLEGIKTWDPLGTLTIHIDAATGDMAVHGNLTVDGTTTIGGTTVIHDNLTVDGTTVLSNSTTIHDDLTVDGNADIAGTTVLSGDTTIHDDLTIDGSSTIGGSLGITANLTVTGTTSLGGTLTLAANLDAAGFTIEGARLTTGTGNVIIDDDTITVGGATISVGGGGQLFFDATGYLFSGGEVFMGDLTSDSLDTGPIDCGDIDSAFGDWTTGGVVTCDHLVETSLRAGKADIRSVSLDDAYAFLDVPVRNYRKKGDTSAPRQVGWVAEELEAAGIGPMLGRGKDGLSGVTYSRAAALHHPVIADHERRLRALEARQ